MLVPIIMNLKNDFSTEKTSGKVICFFFFKWYELFDAHYGIKVFQYLYSLQQYNLVGKSKWLSLKYWSI